MTTIYRDKLDLEVKLVRIFVLAAGLSASPVRCELKCISLEEPRPYHTISYAWGRPGDTSTIIVDDRELEIPTNLERCLQHLRKPDEVLHLWADAICINQRDLSEKANQISIMGDIFRTGTSTYIWLGEPASDLTSGLKDAANALDPFVLVRHFSEDRHLSDLPCFQQDDATNKMVYVAIATYSNIWRAFKDAFEKAYWTRYWTIQEVLLSASPVAVLGPWRVPWSIIKQCEINYRRHIYSCCAISSGLLPKEHTFYIDALVVSTKFDPNSGSCVRPELSTNLDHLLRSFRYKNCQDPRDKVFGILGLVDRAKYPDLIIDYNLSTSAVYTSTMTTILRDCDGDLRCLTGHGFDSRRHELPTWVRDLAACPDIGILNAEMIRYQTYELYNASNNSAAVPLVAGRTFLHLQGVCVDRIQCVGRPVSHRHWPHTRAVLDDWLEVAEIRRTDGQVEVRFDQPRASAFWRTLVGDALVDSNHECRRIRDDGLDSLREWLQHMLATSQTGIDPPVNSWQRSLVATTVGRALFRSKQGFLGLCNPNCQPDDEIWILKGGKVPFVLRRKSAKSPQDPELHLSYDFAGESFVFGAMDGDLVHGNAWQDVVLH